MKAQAKFDEFGIIILAGIIFMTVVLVAFNTPGEFAPRATPATVSLSGFNGTTNHFAINITTAATNVTLTPEGSIASWITASPSYIAIITDGSYATIDVSVRIPKTATAGVHTGSIKISGGGGDTVVPVRVEVSTIAKISSKSVDFGEVAVGFSSDAGSLDRKQNVAASTGYFSQEQVVLIGILNENDLNVVSGADVNLVIEDTNSLGKLIVEANGYRVFDQYADPGQVTIPINKTILRETNVISIRADTPGFFFWTENRYNLRSASLDADFAGALTKSIEFSLADEVASNLDRIQVSYSVEDASSPIGELTMSINGQNIYMSIPIRSGSFNRAFSEDLSGQPISLSGENILSFNLDSASFYSMRNLVATFFYRQIS